ncbi:septum formation initiator family protein [Eubacteriales bacterium OttesenSCG-928-M02]|nr:septum formation initiator family protein [Eubacteriales bacterium OttesenSCG-928-M02]
MKRKWKPTRKTYIILFSVLFLYVGITAIVQWREYRSIKAKAAQLEEEKRTAEIRQKELENTILYGDTDAFIERMVREKLGWVKKGETRYVEEN